MLLGFSVQNYKSFRSNQKISFIASKDNDLINKHEDHIINKCGKRILKSGLIYGANASGKSNLISAIDFSKSLIIEGLNKVNLNKCHFRIDSEMFKQPAVFEYRLVVNDTEYSYGLAISYHEQVILEEWLVEFHNNETERYIFYRYIDENKNSVASSDIMSILNETDAAKMNFFLDGFSESISEEYKKKTILSDIALRVSEQTGIFSDIKKVYKWFENILIISPDVRFTELNRIAADEYNKRFFSLLMESFDTGIHSLSEDNKPMDFETIFGRLPKEVIESIKVDISNAVNDSPVSFRVGDNFIDLIKDDEGNIISKKLLLDHGNPNDMFDYNDESDGTKRLFDLIPLFTISSSINVIIIDEIDRSLHTNLTRKFIDMFFEFQNSEKQLVATTHDSNLLDLELMRKDEIWFVDRALDNSSKIFSLNKFKHLIDKSETTNINQEYLIGRYDAVPRFKFIHLEEIMNQNRKE